MTFFVEFDCERIEKTYNDFIMKANRVILAEIYKFLISFIIKKAFR